MFGWVYIGGEVLYCGDETSVKGPFRSDTAAKQNWNVYSLKVATCKETLDNQITRLGIVIYAAMTELKQRYKYNCEIKSMTPQHLVEFTQIRTLQTKPAVP